MLTFKISDLKGRLLSSCAYFQVAIFSIAAKVKSMLNIMLLFETNLYILNCCLYIYPMFSNFKKLFWQRALTFEGTLNFEGELTFQQKLKRALTFEGRLLLRRHVLLSLYDMS